MLIKFIKFIAVFILFSATAYAQPAVQFFDMEVTSANLDWQKGDVQTNKIFKSKEYLNWKNEFNESNAAYAELDLDGDGVKEIIIAGRDFPARGRGYLLLKINGNKLMTIASFRGGLIFHKESKDKKKYDLHIFEKWYGDMYYHVLKLNEGKYKIKSSTLLPRTIYDASFYERWVELNFNSLFDAKR